MTDENDDPRALAVPAGRVARLTRLGGLTAGVLGNMAIGSVAQMGRGQRPRMRNLLLTPSNVTRIADELAKMRGAAMKIGQLVSMDTGDILPPELTQIMARLRDDAHIMPPAQLKQVLAANWPAHWLRSFQTFDVRPIAAASIGQVHRARLKDGCDLAIKVQYPGVAQSIDSDVANVGALIKLSGLLPKGFELAPYLEEARLQLHQETDYLREGEQLALFGDLLADTDAFIVPQRHSDWSTDKILAMSFVDAVPIEDATEAPQDLRNKIAYDLIDLTLRELFRFQRMQTDPNFANYRFQPASGKIVLLDFGATRALSPLIADQYRRLMIAGLDGDGVALDKILQDIGFVGPDTAATHRAQILDMVRYVFAALTSGPVFDFSDTELSRQMQVKGMALADDGFVPPPLPIDTVFLQRKFGGMFLLAARLGAQVDIAGLIRAHLAADA